ncbi:hypothetical protein H0H92_010849 [Tricholoma furcatifolium]|nr:hypothetical protein H0H92_010849 [Tricholoma furcatifolium]
MQHLGVSTIAESLLDELQDRVIDYLRGDFKSLCACSLVCSRWLYHSRKIANLQAVVAFTPLIDRFSRGRTRLRYSIYTPPSDKEAPVVKLDPKTKGFIELLNAPHSTLGMTISRLKVCGACEYYYCALEYDVLCEAILAILPQLSGIKTLTLHNIIWTRLPEAVKDQIAATTASITNLCLDRSTFANATEIMSSFSIHRFPSVDKLSMIGLSWEYASTRNPDDFDYRREGIRTLEIDGFISHTSDVCTYPHSIHTLSLIVNLGIECCIALIEATKTTLTILNIRIDMIEALYGEEMRSCLINIGTNLTHHDLPEVSENDRDYRFTLEECTKLRSLSIFLDELWPEDVPTIADIIDSASSLGYLETIILAVDDMSNYTPDLHLLEPALLKQSSETCITVLMMYDESEGTIPQVETAREWWPLLSRTGRLRAGTVSERSLFPRSPVLPFVKIFVTAKLHPSGSIKHRAQHVEESFLTDLLPNTQL